METPARNDCIVIAGGSGFIGRHLIPELRAHGHPVVVLTRRQPRIAAMQTGAGNGLRWLHWDPDRPEPGAPWIEALRGARAVINLCGAGIADGRWTDARKRELIDSRRVPSERLVEQCNALDAPPAALIQASGVGYYGTGDSILDESSAHGQDFLAELALAWEEPLASTTVRTLALRFGVALATDGGALPRMLLPFRLFAGGRVGSGEQWLSWIHIRDLVRGIVFTLDSPLIGALNLTAPNPVRNAEFAQIAGTVLGRPAWLPVPRFALELLLGEQATLVCDGQRALPVLLEEAGFRFEYPQLDGALRSLAGYHRSSRLPP